MKKYLPLTVLFFAFITATAQQDAQYSMYRFNGLYINPAYAGSHELFSQTVMYRSQWVKIPGQPQTASVAVHSPFKNDKWAMGAIYTYDRVGVIKTNSVDAAASFRIPVGKKKIVKFCVGLSAGVMHYRNDLDQVKVIDANDPNFTGTQSMWMPNIGFGLYVYSPNFFAGISLPHLLANSLDGSSSTFVGSPEIAHRYYHLLITGGYHFQLGKKVKFTPSVLFKYVPKYAPLSFDLNLNFLFVNRVDLGLAYRINDCYSFTLAVNVTKHLKVGYCYDLGVSSLSKAAGGTHEVMLGFDFNFRKLKEIEPTAIAPAPSSVPETAPAPAK